MIEVKATTDIKAPIEEIWAELTHHEGMIHWPDIHKVQIIEKGKDDPDGLGCIRLVHMPGMYVKEEITKFDINKRMDYLVLETDQPFKHHGGSIELEKNGEKVNVRWTSRLDMTSKNPIIRFIGARVIKNKGDKGFAKGLRFVKEKLEINSKKI